MVMSKWLQDLSGSSMAGCESELAQHLVDAPQEPAGCPCAVPSSSAETQRQAQPGCILDRWDLIVLAPCESN